MKKRNPLYLSLCWRNLTKQYYYQMWFRSILVNIWDWSTFVNFGFFSNTQTDADEHPSEPNSQIWLIWGYNEWQQVNRVVTMTTAQFYNTEPHSSVKIVWYTRKSLCYEFMFFFLISQTLRTFSWLMGRMARSTKGRKNRTCWLWWTNFWHVNFKANVSCQF